MFNKANVVGILIKAKKHGLVFFDGEIVFAVSSYDSAGDNDQWPCYSIIYQFFISYISTEMEKAADAADKSVLFFSAGANF